MRYVGFVLLVFACAPILTGQQVTNLCPKLELIGPSGVTQPGEPMTFAVTMSSTPSDVKYYWKVSRGTIQHGQGTQSIVVRSSYEDESQNIVATLTVEGLAPGCNGGASETAPIAAMLPWEMMDEWGRMPNDDQRGRLDFFFSELANNPNDMGLFYIGAEKKEGRVMLMRKMNLILNHAKFRKFDKTRFIFALTNWDSHTIRAYRYRPGQRQKIDCEAPCKLIYGRDLR